MHRNRKEQYMNDYEEFSQKLKETFRQIYENIRKLAEPFQEIAFRINETKSGLNLQLLNDLENKFLLLKNTQQKIKTLSKIKKDNSQLNSQIEPLIEKMNQAGFEFSNDNYGKLLEKIEETKSRIAEVWKNELFENEKFGVSLSDRMSKVSEEIKKYGLKHLRSREDLIRWEYNINKSEIENRKDLLQSEKASLISALDSQLRKELQIIENHEKFRRKIYSKMSAVRKEVVKEEVDGYSLLLQKKNELENDINNAYVNPEYKENALSDIQIWFENAEKNLRKDTEKNVILLELDDLKGLENETERYFSLKKRLIEIEKSEIIDKYREELEILQKLGMISENELEKRLETFSQIREKIADKQILETELQISQPSFNPDLEIQNTFDSLIEGENIFDSLTSASRSFWEEVEKGKPVITSFFKTVTAQIHDLAFEIISKMTAWTIFKAFFALFSAGTGGGGTLLSDFSGFMLTSSLPEINIPETDNDIVIEELRGLRADIRGFDGESRISLSTVNLIDGEVINENNEKYEIRRSRELLTV